MNIADVMNKMGKHENALIMLGKVKRTEDVKRILISIIYTTPFTYPAIMMP